MTRKIMFETAEKLNLFSNIFQVACRFRWNGCKHVAKLENLKIHTKECQFNPENMPQFLKEHMQENKKSPLGAPQIIGKRNVTI